MQIESLKRPASRHAISVPWQAIVAGLCANLVGIGLARFAYTPLLPSLIEAHWFATSDVVYLGAANLAGYFVGALAGRPIGKRISNLTTLRLSMAVVTASFAACAFPLSVTWFFVWRLLSGIAGGAIMVLVAATVLPSVPGERKAFASGMIFLGLGLGISASGTVIPLLLRFGIWETWMGLAVLSAVLTAVSWFWWPQSAPQPQGSAAPQAATSMELRAPKALIAFYVQFSLLAFALVPTMVFLADFIARGLGWGSEVGALFWILYGIGAIFGPPLYAWLAEALGPLMSMRLVFVVQAALIALFAVFDNAIALGILAVALGTLPPGIVPMALARIHQLVPAGPSAQTAAWSRATTMFAICQALAGYAYSFLFNLTGGSHRLLFISGAIALVIGFLLSWQRE
jgi:predicted MFS family arabinose efflux permease